MARKKCYQDVVVLCTKFFPYISSHRIKEKDVSTQFYCYKDLCDGCHDAHHHNVFITSTLIHQLCGYVHSSLQFILSFKHFAFYFFHSQPRQHHSSEFQHGAKLHGAKLRTANMVTVVAGVTSWSCLMIILEGYTQVQTSIGPLHSDLWILTSCMQMLMHNAHVGLKQNCPSFTSKCIRQNGTFAYCSISLLIMCSQCLRDILEKMKPTLYS